MHLPGTAILILGAMTVCPGSVPVSCESAGQSRPPHKVDPQTQILQYYRQYPDRYILVSNETWRYDEYSRTATHTFTLRNTATVHYCEIEVSLAYQTAAGKVLQTTVAKVPGSVNGLGKLEVRGLKAKKVPAGAETVVVRVTKALICV